MSEYWKSTPKYWCKFCSVYVRDTKLERQNHEATGRHQGNIQRSLRGLHRDHERDEREKQRAKDEVARLNGVVGGAKSTSNPTPSEAPWQKSSGSAPPVARKATVEERKRQMQQLADMGVAIPEEFRRDMAMAGDWQTIAVTPLDKGAVKSEFDEGMHDGKSIGIRKRKLDGDEDEEELAEHKRPQWGSTKKTFASAKAEEEDLDTLLGGSFPDAKLDATVKYDTQNTDQTSVKVEDGISLGEAESATKNVKPEDVSNVEPEPSLGANPTASASTVVFKKRKKRPQ